MQKRESLNKNRETSIERENVKGMVKLNRNFGKKTADFLIAGGDELPVAYTSLSLPMPYPSLRNPAAIDTLS